MPFEGYMNPTGENFGAPKRAPRHLSTPSRKWWESVVNTYALEPHHLRLLTHAAESWDRAQEARKMVDSEGIVVLDRFGQQKPHPAVAIERDSRLMFAKLLRELALDVDAPGEGARPPAIAGHSYLRAS